jgi:(p)ppGpp synthase/HD superfamily hydrolase
MGTMCVLARLGAGDDLLAAAVLHDYLEDVPDPDGPASIREAAGPWVLELVETVTEDKRPQLAETASWELRKREQIDRLRTAPAEAVMVKTADLLHNMVSLLADLDGSDDPAAVWTRFNAAPDRQLWYFDAIVGLARSRLGSSRLVDEAEQVADELRRRARLR